MPAQRYTLKRTSQPNPSSPIDLPKAKAHIGLPATGTGHDSELAILIGAATDFVQARTSLQIESADFNLGLETFPLGGAPLVLPIGPVSGVTEVSYLDNADTPQRVIVPPDDYQIVTSALPGYVVANDIWPRHDIAPRAPEVVQVKFSATVPDGDLKRKCELTILQLVAQWFDARATTTDKQMSVIPWTTEVLIDQLNWGDEFEVYAV